MDNSGKLIGSLIIGFYLIGCLNMYTGIFPKTLEVAKKIRDCRLIKNQPVLDDYYLRRTIKQMLSEEVISQHKAKVMEQAMIVMSKPQKDLDELARFTEQINMFEGISDNEVTDTMEGVTRWCIQNLNRY